jgi:hypothetical protein
MEGQVKMQVGTKNIPRGYASYEKNYSAIKKVNSDYWIMARFW